MIYDKIQNDPNVAPLRFAHQAVKILHRSVHRVNRFVVGDVVSEIHLRGGKARRDPDGIDPEILQIIQFRRDAVEVADAVVVAVRKTSRVDFVEHRVLPPRMAFGVDGFLLGICARRGGVKAKNQGGPSNPFPEHGNCLPLPSGEIILLSGHSRHCVNLAAFFVPGQSICVKRRLAKARAWQNSPERQRLLSTCEWSPPTGIQSVRASRWASGPGPSRSWRWTRGRNGRAWRYWRCSSSRCGLRRQKCACRLSR